MTEHLRLGPVLVVAGPSCVGKSTVIERLLNGGIPQLAAAVGMGNGRAYTVFHATEWRRLERASCDAVLLHYEITRRPFLLRGANGDPALRVLGRARDITFLTLWEAPEEVERRFHAKAKAVVRAHVKHLRVRRAWQTYQKYRLRQPVFARRDLMWQLYREWFDFSATFQGSSHWILRSSGQEQAPRLLSSFRALPFWEVQDASDTKGDGGIGL